MYPLTCDYIHYKETIEYNKITLDFIETNMPCPTDRYIHVLCYDVSKMVSAECPVGTFQCQDGTCIHANSQCDGMENCLEGDDEVDCHSICYSNVDKPKPVDYCLNRCHSPECYCHPLFFECWSGGCVPFTSVCIYNFFISNYDLFCLDL